MIQVLIIFLAFTLIHSITVAPWFKDRCRRAFGETFMRVWYRFLFVMISGVTVSISLWLIRGVPDHSLWTAPRILIWPMHAVQMAAVVFFSLTFQHLDVAEFLGFRQVWRYFRSGEILGDLDGLTQQGLITSGVHGIVRHPMYAAGIVIVTFNPYITVNGLTFTVLSDLYFLFGMFIEERRFVNIFGDQYREYMKKVPRMVPRFCIRGN